MGPDFIKLSKIYLSITLKQYQKALTGDSKHFHWVKVTLFKFRKLSYGIIWNKML